jgi:hypothetical protein
MAGKTFKTPDPSPNDKATLDLLTRAGFTRDPETGAMVASEAVFEGGEPTTADPGNPFGSEGRVETVQTIIPGAQDRLEPDDGGEDLPSEELAEPEPDAGGKPKSGDQTEEGLAKREADARAAQREMSKAKAKLDATLESVNRRISELDEKIEQLSTLQVAAGPVPMDLDPASQEVVNQWRQDESTKEAMQVMDAMVAPLYQIVGDLREAVNGITRKQGEFFAKTKEAEVFGGIYEKIPQAQVKQITESDTFLDWLGNKPPKKSALYVDVLNHTAKYTPEEALDIFREFSLETGTDIGLAKPPKPRREPPPVDMGVSPRTGSALPEATPALPSTPTEDTPLSLAELRTFGHDIQDPKRSEQEKAILRKRFAKSQINIDGRIAQQFQ